KFAREGNHLRRVVSARAAQDRDFALGKPHGNLDDAQMLLVRKCRTFSSGAARNQKIDSRLNLTLDQPVQRPFVQRSIAPERCNERCARAGKTCFRKHVAPPLGYHLTADWAFRPGMPFQSPLSSIRRESLEIRRLLACRRAIAPSARLPAQSLRGSAPCAAA